MSNKHLHQKLTQILLHYQRDFSEKRYVDKHVDADILMETFGVTAKLY